MNLHAVTIATLAVASVWVARSTYQDHGTADQLENTVDTRQADPLYRFVEARDFTGSWDDDELWKALGGVDGIRRMREDSKRARRLARQVKQTSDCQELSKEVELKAFYLSVMTRVCQVEHALKTRIPSLPRIQARSCARLYCDLMASLETVTSL